MKEAIHPQYFTEAKVVCACGNSWITGSTVEVIQTDVCSECHPFYTGEQRIVDTEGQVDRFYKKLQAREDYIKEKEDRVAELTSPDILITELEIGKRALSALTKEGVDNVGQALELLTQGDEKLLAIDGFGRKSLADLKRRLKSRGFVLPEP
jgi:large subunit ribosomal protein L31